MITIIYGTNAAQSRKVFADEKQKAASPLTFSGDKLTIADLTQALEGQALFVESQQLFIEDLLSKRKKSKELDGVIMYINQHHTDHTIFLWESKELTKKQVQQFTQANVKEFPLPKLLFTFLDSLQPGNGKHILTLFHQTLATEDAEFLFFMLVRQIRMLLGLIDPSEEAIDELKRVAPWQKGKLEKQAHVFGKEGLLSLYGKLFTIESGLKTGQLSLPLVSAIDFLLISI